MIENPKNEITEITEPISSLDENREPRVMGMSEMKQAREGWEKAGDVLKGKLLSAIGTKNPDLIKSTVAEILEKYVNEQAALVKSIETDSWQQEVNQMRQASGSPEADWSRITSGEVASLRGKSDRLNAFKNEASQLSPAMLGLIANNLLDFDIQRDVLSGEPDINVIKVRLQRLAEKMSEPDNKDSRMLEGLE